ncbi:hypothetical protein RND71_033219 [Anisodus tanguticus]|uniref:Uncharacterized protein n=1 Tax=Anisodus tanguticus TaxID=243964 RepID=A0AAE1R7E2_9SOLA|nr:hypothetical protein RND71_033219 [Anisodus tanguticus]
MGKSIESFGRRNGIEQFIGICIQATASNAGGDFPVFPYLSSRVQALLIRQLFHRKEASTGKDRRVLGEMRSLKKCAGEDVAHHLLITVAAALLLQAVGVVSVVAPNTGCYALDNSSHIHDFDADLVVRFCKDVESRSQAGYVDYGRFDKVNYFHAGSGHVSFVQEYFNGDLMNCEQSYDKMGRTAKVIVICGNCPHGQCKGGLGCICNVEYESTCRAVVELAVPCEKPGLRVFEGFTVGFHPRSWEIVYNGMTQLGYEESHKEFSFNTAQTHVALYMTAIASVSGSVQKPLVKVSPEQGLKVRLSGSAETGDIARDNPYEVEVTIPIKNYDPIQFTLTKICLYQQSEGDDAARGWAIFGVLSCISTSYVLLQHNWLSAYKVVDSVVEMYKCFVYSDAAFGHLVYHHINMTYCVEQSISCLNTILLWRVHLQDTSAESGRSMRGLDALPGMTLFSACLETVSGLGHGYSRPKDVSNPFANQASWERQPASTQATRRTSEVR